MSSTEELARDMEAAGDAIGAQHLRRQLAKLRAELERLERDSAATLESRQAKRAHAGEVQG